jgi:hypothetical protein
MRRRSARTFWIWAGAVAFALGTPALPGSAQPEAEEPRAPSSGARSPAPEATPIPLPEPDEPAEGQRPPSPENNPVPLPEPADGQRTPSPEINPIPLPEPAEMPKQEHAPRR